MSKVKFEEAKNIKSGEIVTIENLEKIKNNDSATYETIKDSLICPGCEKTKLIPVEGISFHLRTLKGQNHSDNCMLDVEQGSPKVVKNLITDPDINKKEKIRRILENFLKRLKIGEQKSEEKLADVCSELNYKEEKERLGKKKVIRYIYKNSRLTTGIRKEDCGKWQFFYGKVRVLSISDELSGHKIVIIGKTKKEEICRLRLSKNVWQHLTPLQKTVLNRQSEMLICFVGEMREYNGIYTCSLRYSKLVTVENV